MDFSAELDAALKPRRALALARGRALAATPASLRWPFQFPRLWRFGGSRGTNRRATHCSGVAGRPFPPPRARPVSLGRSRHKRSATPPSFSERHGVGPHRASELLLVRWVLRLDIPATGTKQTERNRGAKR